MYVSPCLRKTKLSVWKNIFDVIFSQMYEFPWKFLESAILFTAETYREAHTVLTHHHYLVPKHLIVDVPILANPRSLPCLSATCER